MFQLLWKKIKQCYSESTFWCAQLIPYFIAIFIQATNLLQKESAAEDACLLLHIGMNLLRVLMAILLFMVYVEKGVIDFSVMMFPTSLHNFFHKYWSENFCSKGNFTLLMNLSWKIARFGPLTMYWFRNYKHLLGIAKSVVENLRRPESDCNLKMTNINTYHFEICEIWIQMVFIFE